MVAEGHTQMHEIDYDEAFVPVAKMRTVHVVLVVVVSRSTSSFTFSLGSVAIMLSSKKKLTVALFSTEA